MYKGYYINLEQDAQKRESVQNILLTNNLTQYSRFEALNGDATTLPGIQLTGGEKGCYLSHYSILKSAEDSPILVHILEDDAVFNHKILKAAELINQLDDSTWDIIFTDVFMQTSPALFLHFHDLLKEYKSTNCLQIVNLKNKQLTGTTSYFVNPKSIQKILTLLEQNIHLQIPYDLFLRSCIDSDRLKAFVTIPFYTYPKYFSTQSSIRQMSNLERVCMKFRESFWIDANLPFILKEIQEINSDSNVSIQFKIFGETIKQTLEANP